MSSNSTNNSFTWFSSSLYCADQKCPCANYYYEESVQENDSQQPSTSGISQLVAASSYLERMSNSSGMSNSASMPLATSSSTPIEYRSSPSTDILSSMRMYGSSQSYHDICEQTSGAVERLNNPSTHSSISDDSRPQQSVPSHLSNEMNARERQFVCRVCNKGFAQNGNLKTHLLIHTGERPFPCPLCGRRFTQKGNVDTHMKIHTGERDYRCDSCGKGFSQKGNLKQHMRSVHIRAKPFKCNVCTRSFTQKVNLHAHYRTHNNGARLPCTLCYKTFAHKGSLKTHMQSHADLLALEQYVQRQQTNGQRLPQDLIHSSYPFAGSLQMPIDPFQYYSLTQGLSEGTTN